MQSCTLLYCIHPRTRVGQVWLVPLHLQSAARLMPNMSLADRPGYTYGQGLAPNQRTREHKTTLAQELVLQGKRQRTNIEPVLVVKD